MFYITVGKRKTRVVLATITACLGVAEALRSRLGHTVSHHWPRIWTDELMQARPRNERYHAIWILNLTDGWMPTKQTKITKPARLVI